MPLAKGNPDWPQLVSPLSSWGLLLLALHASALSEFFLALGTLDLESLEAADGRLTLVLSQPNLEKEQHASEPGEPEVKFDHRQ